MKGFFTSRQFESNTTVATKISQCGKCGLYKKVISPKIKVVGEGKYKILFIAEAPGQEEDRQGVQLIRDTTQMLASVLDEVGVDLLDCWKTNAVICHPPNNKIEPYMISCCRPNLLKTIKKLKPNVIVPLGKAALESLLFKEWKKDLGTLNKWIGWNIPSSQYDAWICPTWHPSYLMRKGEDKILIMIFQKHLEQAFKLRDKPVKYLNLDNLEKKVEIILDPNKSIKRMEALSKKKGILAFDYETTGIKPERKEQKIVSVSFCLNGKETFACMIERFSHRHFLEKILRSSKLKKVASNMKFEERWTRKKLGYGVRNWYWDTMLAAHCLDNRSQITSIKFQAYIHLGISDYDSHLGDFLKSKKSNTLNQIDKIKPSELLLYNGLDSLLEYKIMEKQKAIFKKAKQ